MVPVNTGGTGSSDLDVINAGVAAAAFVLAVVSLVWQAITWKLSGSRAKAKVLKGTLQGNGTAYATLPPSRSWETISGAEYTSQGFTRPALFLRVVSTGRHPVQVQSWNVRFPGKVRLGMLNSPLGPALPHRLDVNDSGQWAIELADLTDMVNMICKSKRKKYVRVRLEVELGHGKTIRTCGKKVRLYPDSHDS
jgi:hypothetical protein